jgi:4-amino-4-deoxy-L-arabinose transferase-like glycosyltransferase
LLSSPVTLIGFGILLRSVLYAANASLWADESALALNIIQRTYVDLLQPLDYGQAAPVGFLLLEKFVSLRLGIGEYALRLFPFLSGVASLFLFHAFAKRCLVHEAVPWALFLFAIAWPLVDYSSELKQYSSDVFITLVILLAGFRAREKPLDLVSVAMFGAAGAIGIWFSQPAACVAGGVALALVVSCVREKLVEPVLQGSPERCSF